MNNKLKMMKRQDCGLCDHEFFRGQSLSNWRMAIFRPFWSRYRNVR